MSKFKKGDHVLCTDFGVGHIVKISEDPKNEYPISVKFDSDNTIITYTIDGRCFKDGLVTLKLML